MKQTRWLGLSDKKYRIILKMNFKIISASSLIAVLSFATHASAHEKHFTATAHSPQKSYEFRTSAMTIYKWYLSPMGTMIKGKVKFNAKEFAYNARGLANASHLELLAGFPDKSSEDEVDESSAKPVIWGKPEAFEKKFKAFQVEAQKLASIAKKGDEKAIKAQFKSTAGTCSSCHKKFKTK